MTPDYDDPDLRPEPLARLRDDAPAPGPGLERRVIASLRFRGVLRAGRVTLAIRVGLLLAASLAGLMVGRFSVARNQAPPGPRWMLLLYEDAGFEGPTPGGEASYVAEYGKWAEELRSQGRLVDAAELPAGGGLVESGRPGWRPAEIESAEAGRLTGYFLIAAPSLEEAARIAASCPHLRHRGRVAVRPVAG